MLSFRLIAILIILVNLIKINNGQSNQLVTINSNTNLMMIYDLSNGFLTKSISLTESPDKIVLSGTGYAIGYTPSSNINVWNLINSRITCTFNNVNGMNDILFLENNLFATFHTTYFTIWNYITCKNLFQSESLVNTWFGDYKYSNGLLGLYTYAGQIMIYDVKTFRLIKSIKHSSGFGTFNLNQKYAFIGSDIQSFLWSITDSSNQTIIHPLNGQLGKNTIYKNYLLNAFYDISIYNISNGLFVKKFSPKDGGNRNSINDWIVFEKLGLLATCSDDYLVIVWDLNSLSIKYSFDQSKGGHTSAVKNLFQIGDRYLLSRGGDYLHKLWDLNNGNLIYNFNLAGNSQSVTSSISSFSAVYPIPNNVSYNIITSNGLNSEISIWSLANGKLNFSLNFPASPILIPAFITGPSFPSNVVKNIFVVEKNFLCTSHYNGEIKFWNLASKSLITNLESGYPAGSTSYLKRDYLGKGFFVASKIKLYQNYVTKFSIKVWNLFATNRPSYEIYDRNGDYFTDPNFINLADGFIWITESQSVYDLTKKVYVTLKLNTNEKLSKDALYRISQTHFVILMKNTASNEVFFRVYTTQNLNSYTKQLPVPELMNYYGEYSTGITVKVVDNNYLIVTMNDNYKIMVFDINNSFKQCIMSFNTHSNSITSIVSIKNGVFATGGLDALIKVWDIDSCALRYTFDSYVSNMNSNYGDVITKMVSINGIYLISITKTSLISVWDLNDASLKYQLNATLTVGDIDFF